MTQPNVFMCLIPLKWWNADDIEQEAFLNQLTDLLDKFRVGESINSSTRTLAKHLMKCIKLYEK